MNKSNIFFSGIRPKTLVAAIIPPVVAFSLMRKLTGESQLLVLLQCLGLGIFIQIATNFYNDAIDFQKGADDNRVGPKRVSDKNSYKLVLGIGHASLVIALIFGVPLVIKGGITFLILGLLSLYLAYGYTGGPFPLAYLGLGELFVFLFFGLLATVGSYYLMASNTLNISIWILGSILGFLSCALIAVNNFRDRKTDKLVSKRTLATRLSERHYRMLIDLFLFGPYILSLYFVLLIDLKFIAVILATKYAHLARKIISDYIEESELNKALEYSAKNLLAYGVLFSLCCL